MGQQTNGLKVSFNLKDKQTKIKKKDQKETPLFMVIRWGHKVNNKYVALKYSTGEKVLPNDWDFDNNKKLVNGRGMPFKMDSEDFNDSLNGMVKKVRNAYKALSGKLKTPKEFRKQLDYQFGRGANPNEGTPTNLNEFIDKYIQEITSGKRVAKKSGNSFSPQSVSNFVTFQNVLNQFQEADNIILDFDNITFDFENEFKAFLAKKTPKKLAYKLNTIGRFIEQLKAVMNASFKLRLHKNTDYQQFTINKEAVNNVVLSEKELETLYRLELSGIQQQVRDIFLVGCWTLQRFSDYSRIKKAYIDEEEERVIRLKQMKTGANVDIPIFPMCEAILSKYDYTLPKVNGRTFNYHLRLVCKKAGFNQPIIRSFTKGNKRDEETKRKHELIGTHTARRTGCTILYDNNIPTYDIMKLSGHRTEIEFLKYVNREGQKVAKRIYASEYFSKSVLKVVV